MKKLALLLLSICSSILFMGQQSHSLVQHTHNLTDHAHTEECASSQIHNRLMQNDPIYAQRINALNTLLANAPKVNRNNKSGSTIYTIPVVVHIIHTGQAIGTGANISVTQINSAITRMNNRYRNLHGSSVDTEIQFVLAQRDPDGNATTGIVRVDGSSVTNYSAEGIEAGGATGADEATIKALSRWPATQYYNIWVVTEIADNNGLFGIQGYAYFPGARPAVDGTVIMHTCFGTTGTVNSFNNEGRTLVHELGHGLNLYHTFEGDAGGTTCPSGNGDFVADTDPHIRASSNCPTGTNTCTGNPIDDETNNFMNYSNQSCAVEFTSGQSTRMRAALTASRPSLTTSFGGQSPAASYLANPSCTPATSNTNNGFGMGIYTVDIGGMTVVSDGTVDEGDYIDQTKHQLINITAGASESISISTGNANNEDVAVYIDYNNDNDFADPGETVFTSNGAKSHSGTINVPSSGIVIGTTLRMRVISDFANFNISSSCYNPTYGQTEDYAVLIAAASQPLSVSMTVNNNVSCNGGNDGSITATASGGTTPYSYVWTNGGNTATNAGLSAGTYTVTVTDNSGIAATVTATATISEPTAITATLTTSDESCAGNDGSISVNSVGGTSPYTYFWSNAAGSQNISNLASGTYTVTISDASSCTANYTATVNLVCNASNIMLLSNFCGGTNFDPTDENVYFLTRNDASNYRVRVNGPSVTNFVLETAGANRFNLRDIPNLQYSQTYSFEMAAYVGGQWLAYGTSCNMTMGSISGLVNMSIHPFYCGTGGFDPTNDFIYFALRPDATNYRVRVNGTGVSNFIHITSGANRFNLVDITGLQYGQTYTVELAAFINGSWSNYGPTCSISMGNVSGLVSMSIHQFYCGTGGFDLTQDRIYFPLRPDATNYRVRVNGTGVSNFVHTTGGQNRFNLADITGLQYGQTYTVELAGFINGSWSNYGPTCSITMGNISAIISLTLNSNYCGTGGFDPVLDLLYFGTRPDATNYRVRVNGTGVSNFVRETAGLNRVYLNDITGLQYGETYTFELAAFIGGQWSNYGPSCSVSMGSVNSLISMQIHPFYCGTGGYNRTNARIYFPLRSDATNYRLRVNGTGVSNYVHTTTANRLNLGDVPGILTSTTYTIELAAFVNGGWSNYGPTCSITTSASPSPPSRFKSLSDKADDELKIYPNPASDQTVFIESDWSDATEKAVQIDVLNIKGQLILRKWVQLNDGKLITYLNENNQMKAGIYLINIQSDQRSVSRKLIIH